MKFAGKVVGGTIGLLTLGPIGAALGVFLGHQFDEYSGRSEAGPQLDGARATAIGDQFFRSAFRVMGHVAKSDGRVSESEIAAARAVMAELRLTPPQVRAAIDYFTDGKQPEFNLGVELAALAAACQGRPGLARVFLEIQMRAALGGNNLEGPARILLGRIATRLGVSTVELAQIEAVLRIRSGSFRGAPARDNNGTEQLRQAYSVLEINSSASSDEIVKAYRRQLSRHHPDKLKANGLPESMIEHAKQRTQQIIEAYELIRERRGI
ncbi:MAG TPA: co-chaperone DjlA [Steroidobacteraceae bacterium]|nr:co-chaperone DjlA [Steroidobacteraceae bacterium]